MKDFDKLGKRKELLCLECNMFKKVRFRACTTHCVKRLIESEVTNCQFLDLLGLILRYETLYRLL